MSKKRLILTIALISIALIPLVGAASQRAASQAQAPADMTAPHREIVNAWLSKRPSLRLATEADCQNQEGLAATREEYGAAYQPYYAVGDFNRDGKQDFAVALIDQQRRSRKFAIAIFNGPHKAKPAPTHSFFTTGVELSQGGLIVRQGSPLIAGVFQSDDCVLVQPRGRTYIIKNCL